MCIYNYIYVYLCISMYMLYCWGPPRPPGQVLDAVPVPLMRSTVERTEAKAEMAHRRWVGQRVPRVGDDMEDYGMYVSLYILWDIIAGW